MRATFGIQVLVTVVVLAVLLYVGWVVADHFIYAPQAQPIAFPHDLHAGNRQIACQYCHRGVNHAEIAGVPSVQECMDCHRVVLKDKPGELQKLRDAWAGKKPIEWYKVYQLPKHVKFSHQVHIARGFACDNCHGDVAAMRTMTMAKNPTMGFCVDCHRKNQGPIDCSACHR